MAEVKQQFLNKDGLETKTEYLHNKVKTPLKTISYNYDPLTGDLLSVSSSSKGINNSSSMTYKYGLMVNMSHLGVNVRYAYDGRGRVTKVSLDDIEESLFYRDSTKYIAFNHLKSVLKDFNSNILGLQIILNNKTTSKDEKDIEIGHLYANVGIIISAYNDVLKICFNRSDEQIKYYKTYKEAFCSEDDNLVRLYLKNSECYTSLEIFYKEFTETIFRKISFDVDAFIDLISKHTDVIVMNTPFKGEIIPLNVDNKDLRNYKFHIDSIDVIMHESSGWMSSDSQDELCLSIKKRPLVRWFFYISEL